MTTTDIKSAALRVAEAERALAEAQERQQATSAKAAQLRDRLDAMLARRAQIRTDLDAGRLDDREAGGLLALVAEDEADLRALLEQAVAEEAAAVPGRERQELEAARGALRQAVAIAKVEALREHVMQAEAALLAALGRSGELLREAGRPVGMREVWQPSNDMVRACAMNVLPPPSAPGMGG